MVYRDSLGRFAAKPVAPQAPAPKVQEIKVRRDNYGRYISSAVSHNSSIKVYRSADGRFLPNPNKPKKVTTPIVVTLNEVIDAIEKNGYEQLRNEWVRKEGGKVVAGCALGQGATNLGVSHQALNNPLRNIYQNGNSFSSYIIRLNDSEQLTIPQIVRRARAEWKSKLSTPIMIKPRNY